MTMNRRMMMAAATMAGAIGPNAASAAQRAERLTFPKGFLWGCSTAGHQIEGNNVNSDLWLMENVQPTAFKDRSGDACDSYHRYEEDIALMGKLGFTTYRFSIEWSRIEPSQGHFSNAELDHYKRVIACCHKHGITPTVTFFHVSAPVWFARLGGWLNPDSPKLFANYCGRAARALADGMGYACTINEPQVAKTYRSIMAGMGVPMANSYYAKADAAQKAAHEAATKATGVERFVTMDWPDIDAMTPQLLEAHHQGFAAIKAERSALPTGVTLNIVDFQPATTESAYRDLRKIAYGPWLEAVRQTGDFVGVQTYRQIPIPGKGTPLPALPPMPFAKPNDMGEQIKRPSALGNAVQYIYEETKKPIFVTENGLETDNDERRVWYIPRVLESLHDAMARGVPVIGYSHWSLLDNFEWLRGYEPHFGIVAVDRETFKRTPKTSAVTLSAIVKANALTRPV
jgi:beta-glucosidase